MTLASSWPVGLVLVHDTYTALHGARLALWNILEALISGEVHTEYPLHGPVMRSSGGELDLWTSLLRWGEAATQAVVPSACFETGLCVLLFVLTLGNDLSSWSLSREYAVTVR